MALAFSFAFVSAASALVADKSAAAALVYADAAAADAVIASSLSPA